MRVGGLAWECSCGKVVFSDEAPEECEKCGKLDSFMQMPEEILKSREEDLDEEEKVITKKSKPNKLQKKTRKK